MNIVLAANSDVFVGAELVVYSTLTHNKNVNFFIFTMDIDINDNGEIIHYNGLSDWEKKKLSKIVQYLDGERSNIKFIDTLDLYNEYLKGSVNETSHFTPYATLRLIIDKAIPYLNHCLYLDCDTAIQSDITDMYYSYLRLDKMYCASYAADACDNEGEMVSGVMLMNIKKMKETGFLNRARDNYMKNKYIYPDQMALRDAGEQAYPLPESYGYMYPLETCFFTPAILHFTNKLSPKIYSRETGRNFFYKRYPQFAYVKEGTERLDSLIFK